MFLGSLQDQGGYLSRTLEHTAGRLHLGRPRWDWRDWQDMPLLGKPPPARALAGMLNPGSHTTLTPRQAKRFYNHFHLASCLLSSHKQQLQEQQQRQQQQQRNDSQRLADLGKRRDWLAKQVTWCDPATAAGKDQPGDLLAKMQKLQQQVHVVLQHLFRKDNAAPDPEDLQLLHWCFLFSRYLDAMAMIQAVRQCGGWLQHCLLLESGCVHGCACSGA